MTVPDSIRPSESCVCSLTSAEFINRKNTVVVKLRNNVLESKETSNGFIYKFEGSDVRLDQLLEFIKTERECCNFFNFTLHVAKPSEFIWLELTGPAGSKEFIKSELEF